MGPASRCPTSLASTCPMWWWSANLPADTHIDASVVLLAVEITSPSRADYDRTVKRITYASAKIPVYPLVDRFDRDGPTVTVFSRPADNEYLSAVRTPFGEPAVLPVPFELTVPTDRFPAG